MRKTTEYFICRRINFLFVIKTGSVTLSQHSVFNVERHLSLLVTESRELR